MEKKYKSINKIYKKKKKKKTTSFFAFYLYVIFGNLIASIFNIFTVTKWYIKKKYMYYEKKIILFFIMILFFPGTWKRTRRSLKIKRKKTRPLPPLFSMHIYFKIYCINLYSI